MQSLPLNARNARLLILINQLFVREFVAENGSLSRDVHKYMAIIERRHVKRAESPDDLKIIVAIQEGYTTAAEISTFTAIPYVTVTKLINELEEIGAITTTRLPNDEGGQGGDRKTELHWTTGRALEIVTKRAQTTRKQRDPQQTNLLDVVETSEAA